MGNSSAKPAPTVRHPRVVESVVKDAEWLAELLSYGLVGGSFIPPLPQRDLRDLTRQRTTLIRERASVINRLQKVLEWANLKLASVVSDHRGSLPTSHAQSTGGGS